MEKITERQYLDAMILIRAYRQQCLDIVYEIDKIDDITLLRRTPLIDTDLSVRALNGLKALDYDLYKITVEDISRVPLYKLRKLRQIGTRTLEEIAELCERAGLNVVK
jgi:DNA-directed RNA polymerase alpha subunit